MDNECGDDEAAEGALGLITVEPGGLRRIDRIHRRKPFVYLKVFDISLIKLFDTSMTQCGGQNEIEDQFTPGRVLKMGSYHPEQFHIPGATSPTAAVTIISNNIGCLFRRKRAIEHRRVSKQSIEFEVNLIGDNPLPRFGESEIYQCLRRFMFRAINMNSVKENICIDTIHRLNRYSSSPEDRRSQPSYRRERIPEEVRAPRYPGVPSDAASRRWLRERYRSPDGPWTLRSGATVSTEARGKEFVSSSYIHVKHEFFDRQDSGCKWTRDAPVHDTDLSAGL